MRICQCSSSCTLYRASDSRTQELLTIVCFSTPDNVSSSLLFQHVSLMISSVDSVSPRHDAGDERHPDAVMLGRPRRAESDTLPCAVQHHAVQTQLTPATLLQIPWKRASFLRGLADALTQNRVFLETPGKLCGGVLAPFGIQGDSSDRLRGNRSNQNSASNQQLRSCDGNEETMQKWANSRVMSTSKHAHLFSQIRYGGAQRTNCLPRAEYIPEYRV